MEVDPETDLVAAHLVHVPYSTGASRWTREEQAKGNHQYTNIKLSLTARPIRHAKGSFGLRPSL